MSYDIRFAVKVEGAPGVYAVIGQPKHDSPTYNVGEIFRKCMDWDFTQGEWYPVTEILPKIERGIHEMRFNAKAYKHLEPDNGWGSTKTVLTALMSIMEWLAPDSWERGWNADIPMECIYIAW